MRYFCVVSQEMPPEMQTKLAETFEEVVPLPPDNDLAEPVRCHPDMVFAVLAGRMFLSECYFYAHPAAVERIAQLGGFDLCLSNDVRSARYPHDVAFNIAVWQNTLICRPDVTCPALLEHAKAHGYRVIPVRQGYTGCSCLMTDRAVLTFDRGIAKNLDRENVPCVLFDEGGISLPGYDCGFLGGASGCHGGKIYICGNSATLPCSNQLNSTGYRIISLSDDPVIDYGGIKIFEKTESPFID